MRNWLAESMICWVIKIKFDYFSIQNIFGQPNDIQKTKFTNKRGQCELLFYNIRITINRIVNGIGNAIVWKGELKLFSVKLVAHLAAFAHARWQFNRILAVIACSLRASTTSISTYTNKNCVCPGSIRTKQWFGKWSDCLLFIVFEKRWQSHFKIATSDK